MSNKEEIIEKIAAEIVLADADDLPALAGIHEDFILLGKKLKNSSSLVSRAVKASADLVEQIIMANVDDIDKSLSVLNNSIESIQSILRDKRDESEVKFPVELGLDNSVDIESEDIAKDITDNEETEEIESTEDSEDSFIINLADGDADLISDYIGEAREHCANAEQMLMDLETGEDKDEKINAIFRNFHTIKGAAGFLDLKPIMVVSHECETLLDIGRKGSIQIEGSIADIVFDSIDTLRKLLDGTEEVLSSGTPMDVESIASTVLTSLRRILKNPADIPPESKGERIGDQLIDMGVVSQDGIDAAMAIKDPEDKIGTALVKQNIAPAKAVAKALRKQQRTRQEGVGGGAVKEMVKIETERLDRMIDTIGELVIAESMVGQDEEILSKVSHKVSRNIAHLNKITRELQEMGMSMRLVPVRGTFQKLARAVRDLTRKAGKKVDLEMYGEETEVDRSIIELISDPLMHMIRNAMDHGVEKPSDRVKAGKPETGTVTLKAFHKGGKVHFDIEDDGRGLDKEKIIAKATEKNLIDPNKELTDQEIYKLIFAPGFSTAAKVTDISGRGVGMDVVKRNIDTMRGGLDIESELGKGTKFSMKLPLTLAIIEGMLVSISNEKFIIPTLSVVESLSLTPDMISTIGGRDEMINLRGEMLPLLRTNRLFALRGTDANDSGNTVVIVEDGTRKVGLIVDKLLGQRQTVIKSLGSTFTTQKWISGGAILSDGNIGLIIDINGVLSLVDLASDEVYETNDKSLDNDVGSSDLQMGLVPDDVKSTNIEETSDDNEICIPDDESAEELVEI